MNLIIGGACIGLVQGDVKVTEKQYGHTQVINGKDYTIFNIDPKRVLKIEIDELNLVLPQDALKAIEVLTYIEKATGRKFLNKEFA